LRYAGSKAILMNLIRSADEEPRNEMFRQGHRFSPSRALEAVGDRWSLLIIREALFKGVTRFSEFERRVGVEGDVLAARLDGFVGAGLMRERPVAGHPDETEYVLTPNGRNLEPVIVALSTWADSWAVSPSTERALVGVEAPVTAPDPIALADVPAVETADDAASVVPGGERLLIEISLLGSFGLRVDGARVGSLSVGSQRLLAFLALHDRSVARITMAGAMWPEVSDERAGISLRSALSRLDPATRDAILSASPGLSLAEAVIVDLRDGRALARRLVRSAGAAGDADISPAAISLLSLELLPDWYDDWVLAEAEDWRQLRMNALEAAADRLIAAGRLAEASSAARAAIKVEPLRESAHAALIRVHLAEGNQSEALRVFDRYRALLTSVLDLEPTPLIGSLVAGIRKA
jgi:DNA-binding SARP family transcriptional activator/DNA-binding HxlR family transcriptional regulator